MKFISAILFVFVLVLPLQAQNWPAFRGPNASGVADGANPPTTWDAEKSVNILWKTAIPGLGHSSPVVWGDKVFITTAVSGAANPEFVHGPTDTGASTNDNSKHSWRVYCLDRTSGRVLWEKVVYEGTPKVQRHVKASHANSTPAIDGKHLIVSFGSQGLYCFDLNGKLFWHQDLGLLDGGWTADAEAHWGFGSSPIIYKNLVIVQCDTQKRSFIAAYDLNDGKKAWETQREEDSSWSTPAIYESKDHVELVTSGTKYYRGYDPMTGKELWRLADGVDVKIPTPIIANGLYYLSGGDAHAKRNFYALHAGLKGDIKTADGTSANEFVAWQSPVIKPHIVTPIVYGDYLYVCTDNGVLTQYQAETGEPGYRARLGSGGAFSASPVAADGKLYFANEDGEVFVIKAGAEYHLLSQNPMGEVVIASPAITKGMLIVRGQNHVFAISEKK